MTTSGTRRRRQAPTMRQLTDAITGEVGKVVVGQDEVVELAARRARRRRTRAARGRPGRGEDAARERASRARSSVEFRARPVHAGHAPVRPHRHDDAARRQARLPSGPGLHQRPARRRDQPDAAEDAGGAPRGDAGASGHRRRRAARRCPIPFLVVATQNPIEYEGTYPLPEAQLDRFLLKVDVGYPTPTTRSRCSRSARHGVAPTTLDDVGRGREAERRRSRAQRGRRHDGERRGGGLRRRRSSAARASSRACRSARARARRCTCSRPRRPSRGSTGATSSRRTTSSRWRRRCCVTGSCCAPRPSSSATAPDDAIETALSSVAGPAVSPTRARRSRLIALAALSAPFRRPRRRCRPRARRRRQLRSQSARSCAARRGVCRSSGRTIVAARRAAPLRCAVTARGRRSLRQAGTPDVSVEPGQAAGELDATITARRRGRHVLPARRRADARAARPRRVAAQRRRRAARGARLPRPRRARTARARRPARPLPRAGQLTRGPLGLGTEFESIRDYLPDDDVRQVNWLATARLGRPMSNQYRIEQDRDVVCVVDTGRLMAAPLGDGARGSTSPLDAATAVALVADEVGDRVRCDRVRRVRASAAAAAAQRRRGGRPARSSTSSRRPSTATTSSRSAAIGEIEARVRPACSRTCSRSRLRGRWSRRSRCSRAATRSWSPSVTDPDLDGHRRARTVGARSTSTRRRSRSTSSHARERAVRALRAARGRGHRSRPRRRSARPASRAYLRAKALARL